MQHPPDEPSSVQMNRPSSRRAEIMLVISTILWGTSFAPAREAGEISNAALGLTSSAIGPVLSLGIRFLVAAVVWFVLTGLIRAVRKKPMREPAIDCAQLSPRRANHLSAAVGVLLAIGIIVQHISLDFLPGDRAESVAAFLTSLTVITVPLTLWLIWRDRPSFSLVLAIALAVAGVWLMTRPGAPTIAASTDSISIAGVGFGILCAIVFAFHIIAVNALAPRVTMSRLNGVQFIVVGIISMAIGMIMMMVTGHWPTWPIARFDRWLLDLALLTAGPTIMSYTLMVKYQPQVSPVRAAIIYMLEPVVATGFAWLWASKQLTLMAIVGAGLILLANIVAELGPKLTGRKIPKS